MAERLKDIFFTDPFVDQLGTEIQSVYPAFNTAQFTKLVMDDEWGSRALKAKMHHVTHCMRATLPANFPKTLDILRRVAPSFQGFDAMVFPEYVGAYGLDHWDHSLPALRFFTTIASAEFAIRPFIVKDPKRAMAHLRQWAMEKDHRVRRLASEGCRPRLPWAMSLPAFKHDPTPILPILEILKDDKSDFVRRSVANNLNDISKDNPKTVLEICERWYGSSKNTDWIVKHACRSILKAGNIRALRLFGYGDPNQIGVSRVFMDKTELQIGDTLIFEFDLEVKTAETINVRLEYAVYFQKARGQLSRKVFQIREGRYDPGTYSIRKSQSFKDLSTRKHYPGIHQIAIIINGEEKVRKTFMLKS